MFYSLLELLLVLGIIAALVVASFLVYPKVQASQRAQAEANNIATIQAGVKALYTSASSFTGLTNTIAVQANIFPDNMLSGSGTAAKPINVFKGSVVVAAASTGPSAVAGSSFTITYPNVPAAGGVLDVAKTAPQCQSAGNSNTLIFTSI